MSGRRRRAGRPGRRAAPSKRPSTDRRARTGRQAAIGQLIEHAECGRVVSRRVQRGIGHVLALVAVGVADSVQVEPHGRDAAGGPRRASSTQAGSARSAQRPAVEQHRAHRRRLAGDWLGRARRQSCRPLRSAPAVSRGPGRSDAAARPTCAAPPTGRAGGSPSRAPRPSQSTVRAIVAVGTSASCGWPSARRSRRRLRLSARVPICVERAPQPLVGGPARRVRAAGSGASWRRGSSSSASLIASRSAAVSPVSR